MISSNFKNYIVVQSTTINIFKGKKGIFRPLFRSGRILLKLAEFWVGSCREAVEGSGNSEN
jgi:hypothetical protein